MTEEMKKLGNYINNHTWAQIAVCAAMSAVVSLAISTMFNRAEKEEVN